MTVGRSNKDIAKRAAVLALSKSGYKALQISEKLGISRQRVYVLLNEAERADYLAETKKTIDVIRDWLANRPDGSWTVKEMVRDLYFIGNGKEGSQAETIKYYLRKLGYVPRWVHASYVGAPLPKHDDEDEIDLDEIIEMANANAEKIARASAKPEPEAGPGPEVAGTQESGVPEKQEPVLQVTAMDYAAAAIAAGRVPVRTKPIEDQLSDDLDEIGF